MSKIVRLLGFLSYWSMVGMVVIGLVGFPLALGVIAAYDDTSAQPTPVPCINPPPLWVNRVACTQTAAAATPNLTPPASATPTVAATVTPQPPPTQIRHMLIWCKAGSVTEQPSAGAVVVECQAP